MPRPIDIAEIIAAPRHIDPVFLNSPLIADAGLGEALGCRLHLKVETMNPIGSFKGRGSELFAARDLKPGDAVVCGSAGNFGQGLARAAKRRGYLCTVFTSASANPLKIAAMRRLGAEVRQVGSDFDAAKAAAREHAATNGLRFVEDGDVASIAEGAGTIAVEIAVATACDIALVPLGNGALLAGVGTAFRHVAPKTEIIAVVAEQAPAMQLSLAAGHAVETESADTIADGIAVRVPVASSISVLQPCCDAVVAVSEAHIRQAMLLAHRHLGLVLEPSGAVGIAAILADPPRFRDRDVATILCGRNISDALRVEIFGEPSV